MKQKILLIGGKYKTLFLAQSLLRQGYAVTALNKKEEDCLFLSDVDGLQVIHGDGSRFYVLEEMQAQDYDLAVALTPKDDANLVICELCKKRFGINRTVSLLSDPGKRDFFHAMGVDRVVCAISAVAEIVEQQAFVSALSRTIPLQDNGLEIAEVTIDAGSPAVGKSLAQLSLPENIVVGCILHQGEALPARGDTILSQGDQAVVICSKSMEKEAIRLLAGNSQ